jgi:hypothetical protein
MLFKMLLAWHYDSTGRPDRDDDTARTTRLGPTGPGLSRNRNDDALPRVYRPLRRDGVT